VFWRKEPFDRSALLEAADKARGRGRVRKAITLYRRLIAGDPGDYQVHARIAPLLARRREWADARKSFDLAGAGFLNAGFSDKAIALWTTAAQYFPEDVEYWEHIANEQVRRGRKADAVNVLLGGRARLQSRRQRPTAILLLRQVLALSPIHFEATIDLAQLLKREGQKGEALKLLRDLRLYARGRNVRRLRAAQFWIAPSSRVALDWLLGR
jgi:tetratricopeptide (TPR) repeat protein